MKKHEAMVKVREKIEGADQSEATEEGELEEELGDGDWAAPAESSARRTLRRRNGSGGGETRRTGRGGNSRGVGGGGGSGRRVLRRICGEELEVVGSGGGGALGGPSNGNRGSGKWSRVSETRVAAVAETKTE